MTKKNGCLAQTFFISKSMFSRRFARDLGLLVAIAATGVKMQIFVRTTDLQNRFGKQQRLNVQPFIIIVPKQSPG